MAGWGVPSPSLREVELTHASREILALTLRVEELQRQVAFLMKPWSIFIRLWRLIWPTK
jgi:hypothetical protein